MKIRTLLFLIITLNFCITMKAQSVIELGRHYEMDLGNIDRFYTLDYSPEKINRFIRLNEEYYKDLKAIRIQELNTSEWVDYLLLQQKIALHQTQLNSQLLQLNRELKLNTSQSLIPFAPVIYDLEQQRRRGEKPVADKEAANLGRIPGEIQPLLLQVDSLSADQKMLLKNVLNDFEKCLKDVQTFYGGYDPDYDWWMSKPMEDALGSLEAYKAAIQTSEEEGESKGVAVGRKSLEEQLAFNFINYSPDELLQIADREYAWCEKEMIRASVEMGYGKDWKAALEAVKNTYVPQGEQPKLIKRLYDESVAFLRKHDLITVPELLDETWRMKMMTPKRQLVNPFFTGGEEISISYPTSTMAHADKLMSMRGNNPHFSRATVHHELIPGHGLQQFMNDRYNVHRKGWNPFWGEGWALYWERLLWDLGFPESPEDRVGMLFWRMHRCARITFSLKFHLGEWDAETCVQYLIDKVGHEPANAEGEVRRSFVGGYQPLYQLAYMIGGLQFEALKKEFVDTGKMTYREFHDTILKENQMPVELLRLILQKENPQKNYQTNWRFYDLE